MLELNGVSLSYEQKWVLHSVSFALAPGDIGCLLGPSGCGKTSLLRLIAGFENTGAGEISLAGKVVSRPEYTLPPEQREVGLVFQDYALFPHLNVADNICFGLRRLPAKQREERLKQMLQLVGLSQEAQRMPHQLSGGQQQRVALARALAPKPRLLLLDEPLSNLDVALREKLAQELRDILKQEAITALFVTHDQHEAFALADHIGVLHEGVIQQWDTPYGLYHTPSNRFVANFIGQGMLLPGRFTAAMQIETELGMLNGFSTPPFCGVDGCQEGSPVEILLRPDDIEIAEEAQHVARVRLAQFRGEDYLYTLTLASGNEVLALATSHNRYAVDEQIRIRLKAEHVIAFPPET